MLCHVYNPGLHVKGQGHRLRSNMFGNFVSGVFIYHLTQQSTITRQCVHPPIQKVLSGGSNFNVFFIVDEGREDPNTTISGPP